MTQPLSLQLQLGSEYSIHSEQECSINHIGSNGHHNPFGGRDGLAPSSNILSIPHGRYIPGRSSHDPETYQNSSSLSDCGSGSVSTSPSSNAGSLAFSPFSGGTGGIYQTQHPTHSPLNLPSNPYPSVSQDFPASTFAYSPQHTIPTLGGMSNARPRLSSIAEPSSGMLPPSRSQPIAAATLPPATTAALRDNYTTPTPGLNRHMPSPHPLPRTGGVYGDPNSSLVNLPGTSRSMLSSHNHQNMSLSPTSAMSGSYSAAPGGYPHHHDSRVPHSGLPPASESPPFGDQEVFHEISCDGASITPSIHARIEKGFFMSSDNCWTCYRRNYFSVQVSYTLSPHMANRPLHLVRSSSSGSKSNSSGGASQMEQIQAIAMSLSAAVDGTTGKTIDLVQHTPKRDKGPQTAIQITKLAPTPPGSKSSHLATENHGVSLAMYGMPGTTSVGIGVGMGPAPTASMASPFLPLQNVPEAPGQSAVCASEQGYQSSTSPSVSTAGPAPTSPFATPNSTPPTSTSHTFERIQFKSATANNGKRRAQQQYYHLIVELYVDVRGPADKNANWVKVAQRPSSQVVVRGRSPSHYSNEGPNSTGSRGAGAGPAPGRHLPSGYAGGWMGSGMGGNGGYGSSHGVGPYRGLGGGPGVSYVLSANPSAHEHEMVSIPDAQPSVDPLRSLPSSESSSGSLLPTPLPERSDEEGKLDAYTYFPEPLFEAGLTSPSSSVKAETNGDDPKSQYSRPNSQISRPHEGVPSSHALPVPWTGGVCRVVGLDSSRGIYPLPNVTAAGDY